MSDDASVPAVGPGDARRSTDAGAVLLDVREPDEWTAGHAPEATWIPLGALATRQQELPEGQAIVIVCRSGGRSARATTALLAAGYDATNLAGGMQAWAAAGLPVVTDAGDPGTVT
jgi:rhodanese-related sulfurtransferase